MALQATETIKPMTLGQKRVLKSFNPSNNTAVERLKDLGAEMIDIVEALRGDVNSQDKSGEGQRAVCGQLNLYLLNN
jgi:hypothetical protein